MNMAGLRNSLCEGRECGEEEGSAAEMSCGVELQHVFYLGGGLTKMVAGSFHVMTREEQISDNYTGNALLEE